MAIFVLWWQRATGFVVFFLLCFLLHSVGHFGCRRRPMAERQKTGPLLHHHHLLLLIQSKSIETRCIEILFLTLVARRLLGYCIVLFSHLIHAARPVAAWNRDETRHWTVPLDCIYRRVGNKETKESKENYYIVKVNVMRGKKVSKKTGETKTNQTKAFTRRIEHGCPVFGTVLQPSLIVDGEELFLILCLRSMHSFVPIDRYHSA